MNGQKMFSLSKFRDYWILFKLWFFNKNVHLNASYSSSEDNLFPYVKFIQFTITNSLVWILSDINIYNKFIINFMGIIETSFNKYLGTPIEEINLKSDSPDLCLSSNQILNTPSYNFKA